MTFRPVDNTFKNPIQAIEIKIDKVMGKYCVKMVKGNQAIRIQPMFDKKIDAKIMRDRMIEFMDK